jgi:polar amino acid transport system permease protein
LVGLRSNLFDGGKILQSSSSSIGIVPEDARPLPSAQARLTTNLAALPWWALAIMLVGLFLVYNFITNAVYTEVITNISAGIRLTLTVTLSAYSIALLFGLTTALGQVSRNVITRNAAQLYVQVVRGIPIIVQIFTIALVIVPLGIGLINGLGDWLVGLRILSSENLLSMLNVRDLDFVARGIIALAISYGAFSSEIFRAGIQSIEKGQIEAAQAIGLTRFQSLRLIILPQAIRRVLPPLGNDFIAMLKESSLLSVIGVGEITQLSKKYAAASFRFPETYYTLAFVYLSITLVLSTAVKFMENRLKSE